MIFAIFVSSAECQKLSEVIQIYRKPDYVVFLKPEYFFNYFKISFNQKLKSNPDTILTQENGYLRSTNTYLLATYKNMFIISLIIYMQRS